MKAIYILGFVLALNISASAQITFIETAAIGNEEVIGGTVQGKITTTDGQPAAAVTLHLKGTAKTTTTDENGLFVFKNVKEGSYILEVSMIGLKASEKTIEVKKDQTTTVQLELIEDAKQLSDVVVTSGRSLNRRTTNIGKVEIAPMDLPQAITVVGSGVIREQQANRLSDVIKNVNGVYLTTTRGNVQESFAARGYSFGSSNLFKNGARINSGAMPEMSSIERVEVLKGSSAILFGQVAPGGVVNLVTKEPKFKWGGEASMRFGSYDLYKPAFDVYGPISSNIAFRVNGTFESAGSYRDNVSSKRYYVNPSLLFKLGKKTDLIVEGDYLQHEFTPDFGIGSIDNTKILDVPRSRFMGTTWQYNITKQSTANATLKHEFNEKWKLNTFLSYQKYNRDYFSTERIQAKANGNWIRPLGKILTEEDYYAAQTNLTGHFKTASIEHTLLAGADADRYFTTNNDFSMATPAGMAANTYDSINVLDPGKYPERTDIPTATRIRFREAPINRFGAYVQDLVKISSKFNVLAGIRWSYLETIGIDSTNLLTGKKTSGTTTYDRAFSPRLGLVYKPFETTSVFASYANSFTPNSTSQDIYGNPLKASIIDQYELGVKNEFFNGMLSANVTAYRIVNNNLAQTAPYLLDGSVNSNTKIKMLSGETTSDGVEVDLAAHPIKGLDLMAGYSYNYMRYTKTDTTIGSFKTGERLVNNPAHTANGSAFYTFSSTALKGLKIGAAVFYTGDRFAGWNTDVASINPVKYRSRIFAVEGFTTVDLSAGYTYKKMSLMGKVSNVTNTLNYNVHENYSINPIAPTQFTATVSYKF